MTTRLVTVLVLVLVVSPASCSGPDPSPAGDCVAACGVESCNPKTGQTDCDQCLLDCERPEP